jgi:hypothetical protein
MSYIYIYDIIDLRVKIGEQLLVITTKKFHEPQQVLLC